MPLLTKLLRTLHCRNTHQFFALDALSHLQTESGKRLGRLLLRHHDRYLTGAVDPDQRFRDFHNHVVHVTDGYWGGAPVKAIRWYAWMQHLLARRCWSDAAHAAGVLSHYVIDPLQPMHTAHSSWEMVIHRPFEWSVNQSYDEILRCWREETFHVRYELSDSPGWLGAAVMKNARLAHRSYRPLLEAYRLEEGIRDPRTGFDEASRQRLAELFALAITGWARILERAANEAEIRAAQPLPRVRLLQPFGWAVAKTPFRALVNRLADGVESQAVAALFEEYRRKGKLVEQAPAETRVIRRVVRVHHTERNRRQRNKRLSSQPPGWSIHKAA